MVRVTTPDGQTLDVTSAGALNYYRREPGYTVHDDTDTGAVKPPAKSASKADWVDYAHQVDPDNAAEIDEMTKDELVDTYGGE